MGLRPSKNKNAAMAKADKYFSLYIRLYNAVNEMCQCVTCGTWKHYKEMQLGHWRRRGLQPTRYDERNCAPQCVRCNKWRSGEPERFEDHLLQKYGKETVEEIRQRSLMRQKRKKEDFDWIAVEYYQKFKPLQP